MKLTDNEIRDVTKFLEEGKPLPEKYRFILFEDKREVELIWNGKTNVVTNVILPFQTIEQVDEPRKEGKVVNKQIDLFHTDNRGRQLTGWTNKLIWGDNKLILSSLKNGPLREEIEKQGGIKLIYIDPPFDVGADFSMKIKIGDDSFTKEAGVLEEIAYRDTWGKGTDSFIAMIYERIKLMYDLLAKDGSIYVHCDWRVSPFIRMVLDEIFGREGFVNEIVWYYETYQGTVKNYFPRKHDTIFLYRKSDEFFFEMQHNEDYENSINYKRWKDFIVDGNKIKGNHYPKTDSRFTQRLNKWIRDHGRHPNDDDIIFEIKSYAINSVWKDIKPIDPKKLDEKLPYPTQKPEALLERIIKASSKKGDLVADFFCGSGTTLAVSEKLGRKWIGSDLGKFAIHTTRKRMIDVQRELKKDGKDYRAFEILNLGKYERQHYIGVDPNLRNEEKELLLAKKEYEFIKLILDAYHANKVEGFRTFHGKKVGRLVTVGPINLPVSRRFIEKILEECLEKRITKVDILGFEYEMGLFPNIQEEAKNKGIDLALKCIPRDVFDKRAIEKDEVIFHDVAYIEVRTHLKENSFAIELTDYAVFYNQDSVKKTEEALRKNSSKIVVEKGKIIKVSKDKNGITRNEVLTKNWTDWIDYWSVDYDFESKAEIERKIIDGEIVDVPTGDYIFENDWQSFRTKKNRNLELITPFKEVRPGRRKVAIKVVDIFSNDTMKIIELNIGDGK